ncbi:hypothetical protein [Streptomyces lavendulocolor]|uniref:hypothetical protein n=1 Tax=Streptomyces lavendulocolor TaxID=67316 RepID=UPI0033DF35B3
MSDQPAVNVHAILVGLLSVAHTRAQAEHAAQEVLSIHARQIGADLAASPVASALHRSAEQDVTRVIELADAWAHRPERQDALQELRAALQSGWQQ